MSNVMIYIVRGKQLFCITKKEGSNDVNDQGTDKKASILFFLNYHINIKKTNIKTNISLYIHL